MIVIYFLITWKKVFLYKVEKDLNFWKMLALFGDFSMFRSTNALGSLQFEGSIIKYVRQRNSPKMKKNLLHSILHLILKMQF